MSAKFKTSVDQRCHGCRQRKSKSMRHPPIDRLRALLRYDPKTGLLIWRSTRGVRCAGSVVGCRSKSDKQIYIRIDGYTYSAHHVIWAMMTGEWPTSKLIHVDTNKRNNKWANLRVAARVDQKASLVRRLRDGALPVGGCIEWQRGRDQNGYGRMWTGSRADGTKRNVLVHRVAFELATGIDPRGAVVRHSCDNPSCINPDHLLLGSQADNVADMLARRRGLIGEKNGQSKLTIEHVIEIVDRAKTGESKQSIARSFGISRSLVSMIASGKRWRHVA